jgi:uncharacterized repeat protein (TIGR01451 family)/LPXTG-motif cell wall-anchored protein
MNILDRFLCSVKKHPKRNTIVAAALVAIIVPAVIFAWGPSRATFTYENPAPYVTFNSITDNPKVGDERNFVRIREANSSDNFADSVNLQAGKTYEVMIFYHNNAASNLNDSGQGVAQNVTTRVQMPGTVKSGNTATITGFIDSSNANPGEVWDNAYAVANSGDVALRYVQGSAKIASSNGAVNGAALSDNIFSTGVKLGYNSLDGVIPGCNQYSGYVTFDFTVDQPNFTITKQVSVDGGKTWAKSVNASAGQTILYRLIYQNTGTIQQNDVVLKDTMPTNVSYVSGSSLIANTTTGGSYKSTVDGVTSNGGYDIGSYSPNGTNYLKFSAVVASADKLSCGNNNLVNTVSAVTANGTKTDSTTVTVNKTCTTPTNNTTPPTTNNTVTTSTPATLPQTGISTDILSIVGLGCITAGTAYYIKSKKTLKKN